MPLLQRRLKKRKGLLDYPGTTPRFDPAHVASGGIVNGLGYSAVPLGTGFVNLVASAPTTVSGAPTTKVLSGLGQVSNCNNTTDGFKITGQITTAPPTVTLGAIVQFTVFNSSQYQSMTGDQFSGLLALTNDANHFVTIYSTGNNNSTFTPTLGVPYFIAGSMVSPNTNPLCFVVVNLLTGALFSQKTVALTNLGANATGQYNIGNNNFTSQGGNCAIAAVMRSPRALTLPQLLQWAADPWSFWYPRG